MIPPIVVTFLEITMQVNAKIDESLATHYAGWICNEECEKYLGYTEGTMATYLALI